MIDNDTVAQPPRRGCFPRYRPDETAVWLGQSARQCSVKNLRAQQQFGTDLWAGPVTSRVYGPAQGASQY